MEWVNLSIVSQCGSAFVLPYFNDICLLFLCRLWTYLFRLSCLTFWQCKGHQHMFCCVSKLQCLKCQLRRQRHFRLAIGYLTCTVSARKEWSPPTQNRTTKAGISRQNYVSTVLSGSTFANCLKAEVTLQFSQHKSSKHKPVKKGMTCKVVYENYTLWYAHLLFWFHFVPRPLWPCILKCVFVVYRKIIYPIILVYRRIIYSVSTSAKKTEIHSV